MPVTRNATVPPKSRTFKETDAKITAEALKAGENVGYGDFPSAASARSAGGSLNKMMRDLGLTDQNWATTVFAVDVEQPVLNDDGTPKLAEDGTTPITTTVEKHRGVMLPKKAKVPPAAKKSTGRKRS